MLDDNDIKKLKDVFATTEQIQEMFEVNNKKIVENLSEVFITKTDFDSFKDEYKKEFSRILIPADKKADEETTEKQEATMLKNKVDRHERWINQIAKKVDAKLES